MIPFFSVVMPTYNRANLIQNTLNSFFNQTFKEFEIIIVDDGSTDNTEDVINSITDSRIKYYKIKNSERGAARNYGASIAKGKYVNFFDSDDIAYPNHLQVAYDTIINSCPEVFHLGYDGKVGDKVIYTFDNFDGNVLEYGIKRKKISINSLFVKSSVTNVVPFYEDRELSASEDAVYICQLAARYTIHYNNVVTTTIVEHDKRSMVLASEKQLLDRKNYMINILKQDVLFLNKYGNYLQDIEKEYNYLLTLSCLATCDHKLAAKYYWKYISTSFFAFIDIRTLVFIKKYVKCFHKS